MQRPWNRSAALLLGLALGLTLACEDGGSGSRRVILILVDGFRADMLEESITPNMSALAAKGVRFTKHHSVFPCTTLTNAGAIATGSYPKKSSWWGEKLYVPTAAGRDSRGELVDFSQHVEVRDWRTFKALNEAFNGQLATAPTLFKTAKAAGLRTAILGKPGATFLQDMDFATYFIDTDTAAPMAFARELQARGYALPPFTNKAFPEIVLPTDYLNPYAPVPPKLLEDGVTSDPGHRDARPSQVEAYGYFVKQFVEFILPEKLPDLSFIWLNEPDATMHTYGPGSSQYRAALRHVDAWVGQIVAKVEELGLAPTTDIIVTSDHGATTVSGPLDLFPLRAIERTPGPDGIAAARPSQPDNRGWSVSGQAMLVELLSRAGFRAFNGRRCVFEPLMTGLKADGTAVYPTLVDGAECAGRRHTSKGFPVPRDLVPDDVLVMETAGGDFLYVPSHDPALMGKLVRFLQERGEIGAIFVNSSYGEIPGTLPMTEAHLQGPEQVRSRVPDIAISYWTDSGAEIFGVTGIGYHNKPSPTGMRGDHGAFAPQDIQIAGFAVGPDFLENFADPIPTANVDLAPTIAALLRLDPAFIAQADGRVLREAFRSGGRAEGRPGDHYRTIESVRRPATPATGLRMQIPTSPDGRDIDPTSTSYTVELRISTVSIDGVEYRYLDSATGVRK